MNKKDLLRLMAIRAIQGERTLPAVLQTSGPDDVLGKIFIDKLEEMGMLTETQLSIVGRYFRNTYTRSSLKAKHLLEEATQMTEENILRADKISDASKMLRRAMHDLACLILIVPGFPVSYTESQEPKNIAKGYINHINELFETKGIWRAEAEFPGRGRYIAHLQQKLNQALRQQNYKKAAKIKKRMDNYALEDLNDN